MKVLLIGSLVSNENMEYFNKRSTVKASIAPINYETMLSKGIIDNGNSLEAITVPPVAAFPNSSIILIKIKLERLFGSVDVIYAPFINIQMLKQATIKLSVYRILKKWLKQNSDINDKLVVMYSIYPPYTEPAIKLCRKYQCHLSAIITDLPELMYTWHEDKGIKGYLSTLMQQKMIALQDQCDSYILFTKYMKERMNIIHKPCLVSEGLSDITIYDDYVTTQNSTKFIIIYAGNLSRLYGIKNLIDAVHKINDDRIELHLYGYGEDVNYIKEIGVLDTRIKYFGRVTRNEVLQAYLNASLIAINKPTNDEYSKYSFSSKILECMLSGTPVLSTKVPGMPIEYYPYLLFIEDETVDGIADTIVNIMKLEHAEPGKYYEIGKKAKEFAKKEKNYLSMTKEMCDFWKSQIHEQVD